MLKVLRPKNEHHKRQMIKIGKFLGLQSIEYVGPIGDSYRLVRPDGEKIVLDISITRTSVARKKYFESRSQAQHNIQKCPYKNSENGECISCKARAGYIRDKSKERYWGWVKDDHYWLTSLRPHSECNTGR